MRVIRFLAFVAVACLLAKRPDPAPAAWELPAPIRDRVPQQYRLPASKPTTLAGPPPGSQLLYNPLLRVNYDGSGRKILAACGAFSLSEEDLMLHLMLKRDDKPEAYYLLQQESLPDMRAPAEVELKKRIMDYFYTQTVAARMGPRAEPTEGFDALRLRELLYPIYEFVWTQNVIRSKVSVSKNEEQFYYRNHPEEFVTPRTATARYILRRLAPDAPEDQKRAERDLMETLAKNLKDHPQLFEAVARQYSQAPNAEAGGRVGPFTSGFLFDRFAETAFDLQPDEVSDVIEGPDGLCLIQLIQQTFPAPIPFDQAEAKARSALVVQRVKAQFDYELGLLREETHPEVRTMTWTHLTDEDYVVRVGDFKVTKAEFWQLYPNIIAEDGAPQLGEIGAHAERLLADELIRQDLEHRRLDDDPRIVRARQMALALWQTQRAELQYAQEHWRGVPVDATSPPADLYAKPRKRLFRIVGAVETPSRFDANTLERLRAQLPLVMQDYVDQAMAGGPDSRPAEKAGEAP
ncbi:MAG: peptidylprolyl isomerase, partial [Candidatus Sumerlaeota bacterium]|nr:peptidylprolyl isomerase [Candidatus Sumerlaeota bacterium]